MLNDKIWKDLLNFEGIYQISSYGEIRNKSGRLLKTYLNNSGYVCIDLNNKGIRTKHTIHRLVATMFLEKEQEHTEVNHIDEDKQNNHVDNLKWCTSSENKQHSIKSGKYNKIFTQRNSLGKKHLPNSHSSYHNVSFDKNRNKWVACIRHNSKNLESKRFSTEVEAAKHVNYLIDKYNLTDRPKNNV